MKKIASIVACILASATMMLAITPATAADVDINIVVPGALVQSRPSYIQPQYENDWRERQQRAYAWRDGQHGPDVHGPKKHKPKHKPKHHDKKVKHHR
jgi:hypothetical protein